MMHHLKPMRIGKYLVKITKPHGFPNEWYVTIYHPNDWLMKDYCCNRNELLCNIQKDVVKMKKQLRVKKFRMEYSR